MGQCHLCGRRLQDNEKNYGSGCIKKCYSLLGMDYKNIKNREVTLNNRITKMNDKTRLNAKNKIALTDRYLTLSFLKNIDIDFYDTYKISIENEINNIDKIAFFDIKSIKLQDAYEIYKFYNRFSPVLKNNTKEIILSDTTQNIVWNALNFGLSRYYNKKKYLEGITQQLQYIFWKSGVGILNVGGYNISAELLDHAISENPSDLTITGGNIVEKIKENENFKLKVNTIIQATTSNSIDLRDSIEFAGGDLAASLHIMDLTLNGSKIDDKWILHVSLEDVYDFTDLKELHEYIDGKLSGFILSTANNAAILSTSCGVLNKYNITIEFDYEIGD